MQRFDTVFSRRTAKQRYGREARVAPLAIGNLHHHRFFQFVDAEDAVIK
ncbi:hypothetical protein SDC9_123407 [bioreactor metagenome]|uniref:Uncharacterized protein n=1 Tax=bioreactor metagenome TaxID=1076179 RepID=A0A645CHK5_9ZZZZ